MVTYIGPLSQNAFRKNASKAGMEPREARLGYEFAEEPNNFMEEDQSPCNFQILPAYPPSQSPRLRYAGN